MVRNYRNSSVAQLVTLSPQSGGREVDAGTQLNFSSFSLRLQSTGWLDLHSWWVFPPQFCLSSNTPGSVHQVIRKPQRPSATRATIFLHCVLWSLVPQFPAALPSAQGGTTLCRLSDGFPPHALRCSFLPGRIYLQSFIVGRAAVQSLKDSSLICNFYVFSLGEFLNLLAFS